MEHTVRHNGEAVGKLQRNQPSTINQDYTDTIMHGGFTYSGLWDLATSYINIWSAHFSNSGLYLRYDFRNC